VDQKPVIFFDTETTGTSTTKDRMVQLAAYKKKSLYAPSNDAIMKCMLINPAMPIPEAATAVHGITTDMVKDRPTFKQFAKAAFEFFQGCNVAGHNVRDFDVPLLSEEFARYGYVWPDKEVKIFDTLRIFRIEEKRDLASALKFYTGEKMEGSHDAGNDTIAACKILEAQIRRYEHLQNLTDEELDLYCMDGVRALDISGKIILNEKNEPVYSFGKAKNKLVTEEPGFGQWMLNQDFPTDTKNVVRELLFGKKLF
jgi:DNA polymerase-3 subunit epsilon